MPRKLLKPAFNGLQPTRGPPLKVHDRNTNPYSVMHFIHVKITLTLLSSQLRLTATEFGEINGGQTTKPPSISLMEHDHKISHDEMVVCGAYP